MCVRGRSAAHDVKCAKPADGALTSVSWCRSRLPPDVGDVGGRAVQHARTHRSPATARVGRIDEHVARLPVIPRVRHAVLSCDDARQSVPPRPFPATVAGLQSCTLEGCCHAKVDRRARDFVQGVDPVGPPRHPQPSGQTVRVGATRSPYRSTEPPIERPEQGRQPWLFQ